MKILEEYPSKKESDHNLQKVQKSSVPNTMAVDLWQNIFNKSYK